MSDDGDTATDRIFTRFFHELEENELAGSEVASMLRGLYRAGLLQNAKHLVNAYQELQERTE